MLNNNWLALIITFAASLAWLRINDWLAHRKIISSQLSRKIIHIGTGPIFVICWYLFDGSSASRYIAAIVPLVITIQFALVGLGILKDEQAVKAMSRSGNPREILRGPLFYGIIFVILTIIYWRDNPIGIVALMMLCGGDGLADILGRRWGNSKLPWAKEKSWVGSFGMLIGGWTLALGIVTFFSFLGIFQLSLNEILLPITVIAFAATLVESIPIRDIDNISITITAVILGHLLFV